MVIGDSHLNRINKSRFKNDNVGNVVCFECFSGSNTKKLNYYVNPTLIDEQPTTVIVRIASNDINKFNHSKGDVEDLVRSCKNVSQMVSIILRYCEFW